MVSWSLCFVCAMNNNEFKIVAIQAGRPKGFKETLGPDIRIHEALTTNKNQFSDLKNVYLWINEVAQHNI